jgi:predicted XRE-type DNA-binding protein
MSKAKADTFASVWDAIIDDAQERANLRVRSDLMGKLAAIVSENGWTQAEAATRCGVTQPRINDLLRGRLSRFSLDALVNIAAALGQRVHVELDAAGRVGRGRQRHTAAARQPVRRRGEVRGRKGRITSGLARRRGEEEAEHAGWLNLAQAR